jgi:hypothetical protein
MAEARGLLVESVGNGFQAKGFQLYARLAGTGLGETGDAYRVYLFSVFDELAKTCRACSTATRRRAACSRARRRCCKC